MRVIKCKVCGVEQSSIFSGLTGSHLQIFEREKTVHQYPADQIIFYEGDEPQALYWACAGRVKLYKKGEKGEELILRLLGPGEIMGYRALLAGELYAATAQAVEDTAICSISKPILLDLLRRSPELALRLLTKMAKELRYSEELALSLAQKTVRQRTAHMLLLLLEGNKQETISKRPLKVSLGHRDMAHMIGTSPESFSRALHYLSLQGILRTTRNGIYVQNFSALKKFVNKNNQA